LKTGLNINDAAWQIAFRFYYLYGQSATISMQEIVIRLNFRPNDFRELYYKGANKNIWYFLRKLLSVQGILLIATATMSYYANQTNSVAVIMFMLIISVLTILYAGYCIKHANGYLLWRSGVEKWLKEYGKYKENSIVLNENCFEFNQDTTCHIEKWDAIKTLRIETTGLFFAGSTAQYLFPAKSMHPEEYDFFTKFMREKVKNTASEESAIPAKDE
jgi:hypothetical protein